MSDRLESPAVFAILSALVEDKTGLHYGLPDRELFCERVAVRAGEAGFDSLLDYYYFLRYDALGVDELRALIDALVVNETFFFREVESLSMIVKQFLLPAVRAGRRPRVWSAACATGEEPLTLAMLLADQGLLDDVDIHASDISDRALARARAGSFSLRSMREGYDVALSARWMTKSATALRVAQELIDSIQWRKANLTDRHDVAAAGHFDVILCRNVLIYFSDDTVVRVLRSLMDVLKPQGAVVVGVSESLSRFGTFLTCEERDRVFFYRKVQ